MKKINFSFRKNQVLIYTFALMLVVAGYLNYTDNNHEKTIETSSISDEQVEDSNKKENELEENELEENENEEEKVTDKDINDLNKTTENEVKVGENEVENREENNEAKIGDAQLVSSSDLKEDGNYFTNSKIERDSMYSQMLETYEKILNSTNATETQKQSASEEITKINNTKNSIMISENLLKTKGFEDTLIFVNGDSINVIVKADELKQEEVSQIQNIISRELNAEIKNIHIANK